MASVSSDRIGAPRPIRRDVRSRNTRGDFARIRAHSAQLRTVIIALPLSFRRQDNDERPALYAGMRGIRRNTLHRVGFPSSLTWREMFREIIHRNRKLTPPFFPYASLRLTRANCRVRRRRKRRKRSRAEGGETSIDR